MSGLAAHWQRDGGPADEAAVRAMLAAIPYRGPDGAGLRSWPGLALGHARLVATPEDAAETQPLVSPRTGCAVVADARLDNRAELLAALPDAPAGCGDAELILRAYEHWGLDAAPRLLGDFAFLLWDPRRQRLLAARDTSGQRPLYYRLDGRTFAAASEVQQLLQDPAVPLRPNEARIRDYLTPLNVFRNERDQAATFYEGILALPAGHMLLVERDTFQARRYWELPRPAELRYRRDEEYAEHYRDLLSSVVRARLRSAHPVGALLSGGIDSASLVCLAQEELRAGRAPDRGFASFSMVFPGMECDERPFIAAVPAKYGFPAHYVPFTEGPGRLQLRPAGFLDGPNVASAASRDALLMTARAAGVRTLLSGDLADACTAGSPWVFDALLRRGRLGELGRRLRRWQRASGEPWRRTLALGVGVPLLPLDWQRRLLAAYSERQYRRMGPRLLPPWMPAALREALSARHLELCLAADRALRFANPARQGEYAMLYPPDVVRHPAPWGLELSLPFSDRRLHEFLLAVPPERKFAPHPESDELYAGAKRLPRLALRGILPEAICTRTDKTVFAAPFGRELEGQWADYRAAFGPGGRSEVAGRGYIEAGPFWERLGALRQGRLGADFLYVLQVVGLESWLRALALPRRQAVTVAAPGEPAAPVAVG